MLLRGRIRGDGRRLSVVRGLAGWGRRWSPAAEDGSDEGERHLDEEGAIGGQGRGRLRRRSVTVAVLVGSISREEHVQHSSSSQNMLGKKSAHKEKKNEFGMEAGEHEEAPGQPWSF